MKARFSYFRLFVFFLLLLFPLGGLVRSGQAMSSEEEKRLGKQVLDEIVAKGGVVNDLTLQTFLNRVGRSIVNQAGPTPFEFDFYVLKANDPNAFAIPGGHIFVTTGLLAMAENESEIAGVLGHEVAHVTGRHVAQMLERAKRFSLVSLAAMLAGAIAGRGGTASQAVATTAMATVEAMLLKYTRENETDADQNGLHYLTRAGYDPHALISFLKKMERYSLVMAPKVPQYLMTHPALDSRISLMENLLSLESKPAQFFQGEGNYKRIQMRGFVEERDPSSAVGYFESLLKSNPNDSDVLLGLGLAFQKAGRLDRSIEIFQSASQADPGDAELVRELGIACFLAGRLEQSMETLESLDPKDDLKGLYYLGRVYQEKGGSDRALSLFLRVKKGADTYTDLYYNLGSVYGRLGQKGLSHYSFGRYFELKGDKNNAILHYRAALDFLEKGSPERLEAQRAVQELAPVKPVKKEGNR